MFMCIHFMKDNKTMLIAVVGAGGKTTISYTIGKELANKGDNVLFTTTTKIWPPQNIPVYVGNPENIPALPGLSSAAKRVLPNGKLQGYSPAEMDSVLATGFFDYIITEADGAIGRPIKCPNDTEPVYPTKTDLIIGVIGLDSIGKRITDDNVHRELLFSKITESRIGDTITSNLIIKLINHPDGLFRHAPASLPKVVCLNKFDALLPQNIEQCNSVAPKSKYPVVVTSRNNDWFKDFYTQHLSNRKD